MARYIAYTNPLLGHVYPTVPTLVELGRRGHDVIVYSAAAASEPLGRLGLEAVAVDPALEQVQNDDWRARTPIGAQKRDVRTLARRADLEIPELESAIERHRPDALIVDVTAFGASTAAERSGLPWAHAVHFPIPIPSRDAPPYGLGLRPRHDLAGRVRDALAERLVLRPLGRILLGELNPRRTAAHLPGLRDPADYFSAAPLVLYHTAEPFEYPRSDWPANVRLVGPGAWDPPGDAPEWLDAIERPLVLVSCSSDFQDDGRLVEVALEALAGEDVFVVATTAAVDPGAFVAPPNARIERYVPHAPIIRRAACVVCHGGMGVTQKALAAGVPVCAVPFGRDQFEVARRVEVGDAGTRLPASRLRGDRLLRAVRAAMDKRAGAQRAAAGFAAAGGAAAAADALEELVSPEPARGDSAPSNLSRSLRGR
jgi:UDP:flavonoid glycosyltransferase YjiC (YdhE family)